MVNLKLLTNNKIKNLDIEIIEDAAEENNEEEVNSADAEAEDVAVVEELKLLMNKKVKRMRITTEERLPDIVGVEAVEVAVMNKVGAELMVTEK